jgi:hypothetical protein
MSKTPIDPKDIREGDRIRIEAAEGRTFGDGLTASEFIAREFDNPAEFSYLRYYLLDRPKPPVDLPSEPTLGWVTSVGGEVALSTWRPDFVQGGAIVATVDVRDSRAFCTGMKKYVDHITAFTPATAVPTEALDELRREHHDNVTFSSRYDSVKRFLTAVDKAANA